MPNRIIFVPCGELSARFGDLRAYSFLSVGCAAILRSSLVQTLSKIHSCYKCILSQSQVS